MGRVGSIVLSALLLASLAASPASAGGDGSYRKSDRPSSRGSRGVPCRCVPVQYRMLHSPAVNFNAFYYSSRGGIGRGYSTTVYDTDGYAHYYRN